MKRVHQNTCQVGKISAQTVVLCQLAKDQTRVDLDFALFPRSVGHLIMRVPVQCKSEVDPLIGSDHFTRSGKKMTIPQICSDIL